MDKRKLILSVAGSGKTSLVIRSLSLTQRALIVTYTDNNVSNIKQSITAKFGFIPQNFVIMSYFHFLYSFCFKPFLSLQYKSHGIDYQQGHRNNNIPKTSPDYYMSRNGYLYSERLADLIINGCLTDVNERIDKYFDNFYVDEVQDFAGYDFDLLLKISLNTCKMLLVGDFYQHTFDTSRRGTKTKRLNENYTAYCKRFSDSNYSIDTTTLSRSFRCSPEVCDFVQSRLGICIESNNIPGSSVVQEINNQEEIKRIMEDNGIVKLFYWKSKDYNCRALNWGDSKGVDDFIDVCVVLNNKTANKYDTNKLNELSSLTKNKLYVAFTRAHANVYIVRESDIKDYKITT